MRGAPAPHAMAKTDKTFQVVVAGTGDANLRFTDLRKLVIALGFEERVKGDHHVFSRDGVVEIINLQPLRDGKAKAYQVRQVRNLISQHGLAPAAKDGS